MFLEGDRPQRQSSLPSMPIIRSPDAKARQKGQSHHHRVHGSRTCADQRLRLLLQQGVCQEHDSGNE